MQSNILSDSPKIREYPNFATPEECHAIIQLGKTVQMNRDGVLTLKGPTLSEEFQNHCCQFQPENCPESLKVLLERLD